MGGSLHTSAKHLKSGWMDDWLVNAAQKITGIFNFQYALANHFQKEKGKRYWVASHLVFASQLQAKFLLQTLHLRCTEPHPVPRLQGRSTPENWEIGHWHNGNAPNISCGSSCLVGWELLLVSKCYEHQMSRHTRVSLNSALAFPGGFWGIVCGFHRGMDLNKRRDEWKTECGWINGWTNKPTK